MFFADSDLSPLKERLDKIVYGLTRWEPKSEDIKTQAAPLIVLHGRDHAEAMANMNTMFLRNQWGDGLPLIPATHEQVDWILTGTDTPRETVVGMILPRGGIATVEQIAVSLAMAGGRPEYLPVLIAVVEALVDPLSQHAHMATTTGSNYPVVIVNGPIAKQVRLNSGYGCLGPDPNHPAGASIGRALRLLQLDVGGAVPGSGTMAIYGGANRYTNIVFAEDEEGLPPGWEPLSVERGFAMDSNVVTIHFVNSTINICRMQHAERDREQSAMHLLHLWAGHIGIPNPNYFLFPERWEHGSPGIFLMARGTARELAGLGWTKDRIKDFLWEETKIPLARVKAYGFESIVEQIDWDHTMPLPVSKTPRSLTIVVAGGEQSGHSYFMPNHGYTPMSRAIKLPDKTRWAGLLARAEEDLGQQGMAAAGRRNQR